MGTRILAAFITAAISIASLLGCEGVTMQSKKCACEGTPPAGKPASAPAKFAAAVKPQASRWSLTFTDDFNGSKLSANWQVVQGQATLDKGALTLKAPSENQAILLLKTPEFSGSVRLEFDASISGSAISDLSTLLNTNADRPLDAGYVFQFGGLGNTQDRLRREGDTIAATVKATPLLTPAKKYHVVAENDGGKLTLYVDDKLVFQYSDPKGLSGPQHKLVGFYTWDSTVSIDRVMVYTK